jgi:carbon-monoxide dehydrogenase medium subunit
LRPFELFEPETVGEAIDLLSLHGDKAKLLAGGVDLISKMRRWQVNPQHIISIQKIRGLDYIGGGLNGGTNIGALATLRSVELSPVIRRNLTLLWEAISQIASIQVKTMGTVAGNLCVGTPASDVATALLAMDASVKIVGSAAERTVPIENFFVAPGQTILQPDELVTEVSVPNFQAGTGISFQKLAHTGACIAKINVAVSITVANGICQDARIAMGAVAPTVIRAARAEGILRDQSIEERTVNMAAETASKEAAPITDLRSTAEYRKEMVKVLVRRAVKEASNKARTR